MLKLIASLGLINLAFSFPLLSSISFSLFYIYKTLTPQEKTTCINIMSSIYSNSKLFVSYLYDKASELNISIQDLRNDVVVNLEVPESSPADIEEFYNHDFIRDSIFDDLTLQEQDLYNNSTALKEKVLRTIKEALAVPNSTWVEAPLKEVYGPNISEEDKSDLIDWGIQVDWNKTFTEKDFRKLKAQLKAVGRNSKGEIVDEVDNDTALCKLNMIYGFFTQQKFNGIDYFIN